MDLNQLVSDLIVDSKGIASGGLTSVTADSSVAAFLPELILCLVMCLMLLVRVTGRLGHSLDTALQRFTGAASAFYIALLGAIAALVVSAPWVHLSADAGSVLSDVLNPSAVNRMEIFTGMLVYDSFTVFIRSVLLLFLVLFIVFTRLTGIPDREDGPDIYTLVFGATLGMCLMASANHLLMVFMAVEMASVPSYVLAGMVKGRKRAGEAALKYSVYGAGAAGVMLYGISLLTGVLDSAHLPTMAVELGERLPAMLQGETEQLMVLSVGAVMVMAGLAFKLSAFPFHFWCPDVFEGATAEVDAFLSVASKAAALALLLRVCLGLGAPAPDGFAPGQRTAMRSAAQQVASFRPQAPGGSSPTAALFAVVADDPATKPAAPAAPTEQAAPAQAAPTDQTEQSGPDAADDQLLLPPLEVVDEAQPAEPQADTAQPDTAQPDTAQPDAAQPDAAQPDAAQPDAAQPDAAQPDAAQPDAAQPDAAQPDAAQPDDAQPDAAQPDTAQPDTAQPDTAQPDTAQPDAAQPDDELADMEAAVPVVDKLAPARSFIAKLVAFFAVITCTFGNLAAYAQTNIKRLLAYSTIAHAGYMMMAVPPVLATIGLDADVARKAAASLAIYIGVYLFMNLGAFAVVAFLRNSMRSEEIDDYAGLLTRCPMVVVCFALILFSLVGLPPLAGFIGKFAVFGALADGYRVSLQPYLLVVLVAGGINTAISLYYYLRVVKVMTMAPEPEDRVPFQVPFFATTFVVAVTLPTLGFIIGWDRLNEMALAAARYLIS